MSTASYAVNSVKNFQLLFSTADSGEIDNDMQSNGTRYCWIMRTYFHRLMQRYFQVRGRPLGYIEK